LSAPNSVFQVVVYGDKLDILPSYRLAMSRHLQLVLDNPAAGRRARAEYDVFLAVFDGDDLDPHHFAIRHAVSTMKPRRDIMEHRLSTSTTETSEVAMHSVDTGFDPTFEVLVSSYWIRIGVSSLDQEIRRISHVARTHFRLSTNTPVSETVANIVRTTDLNGGLPLICPGDDPERAVETLGETMVSWLRRLAS
jgi:hypothetical protein